jgi:LPS export ABC transporter protein LptC/lipopolysaccharide transport protein LptA
MRGTRLLSVGKLLTILLFAFIVAATGLYLLHHFKRHQAGSDPARLDNKQVAIFTDTHYTHESNGHLRFILSAGTDVSYEDGTHQLEKVKLESHGVDGTRDDVVTADHGVVTNTSDMEKLTAEFTGNVKLETSDGFVLKTEYLKFDQASNTVSTPQLVEFQRKNVDGKSTGMMIEAGIERVHLLKDVTATVKPEGAADSKDSKTAQSKVASAPHHGASLSGGKIKSPTTISGNSALLEKREHLVTFTGNVVITQGSDDMRSNNMVGYLDASNHIQRIEARGNSSMRHADVAEVKAPNMDFFIADGQRLDHAVGIGGVYARSLGDGPLKEANADTAVVTFVQQEDGNVPDTLTGDGNAIVHLQAPPPKNERANPTDRDMKADHISLKFLPDGKNLKTAGAEGHAILTVTPTKAIHGADKKTIHAKNLKAEFFEDGNRVKEVDGDGGVKVELESLTPGKHPMRVTTSRTIAATFLPDSQDVDKVIQEGNFTFNEGDRNGMAERAVYDGPSDVISLRGNRPVASDSKARTQADEVDYDNAKNESHARGDVRTTYYDPTSAGNSTPFKKKGAPFMISANKADERNDDGVVIYTGNAKGWQDDNFVKADVIELYHDDKHMIATGHVQSGLYTIERETSPGKKEVVPVFATSDSMTYFDQTRLVHYEGDVKTRQGSDKVDAFQEDVYLKEDTNDVDHMIAKGNVQLTQTGRHGNGDVLTYTAADGRGVLVGKNARIDDVERGSTMGAQLTFYSHDDKVIVDNQHGTGRVRSIHHVEKGKEKP